MKRGRSLVLALAVSVLAPLPLLAQSGSGQPGQPGQEGRGGRGGFGARALVESGSVEFLVTKATDLELTTEQTSQLTAIGTKWSEDTKATREQVKAALPQPGQGGAGAGGGDREAMRARMQELQPVLQKLREDDEKALEEAMKLLGEPQQVKAKALLQERAESMRGRRGAGGPGGGGRGA